MDPDHIVCIQTHWMSTTRLLRYLNIYESLCNKRGVTSRCVNRTIKKLLLKISQNENHTYHNYLQALYDKTLHNNRYDGRYILQAFTFLLENESPDGCRALIEQIGDRVHRCESAYRESYFMTLTRACDAYLHSISRERSTKIFSAIQVPPRQRDIECPVLEYTTLQYSEEKQRCDIQDAVHQMHFMTEMYLDTHKEKSFLSAMQEPARFYYNICGNTHHRDHVNVHGLNGYLCILGGTLNNYKLPLIVMKDDHAMFKGCCDHWSHLKSEAWVDIFSREENFGKQYEGMVGVTNNVGTDSRRYLRNRCGTSMHEQDTPFLRNIREGTGARHLEHAKRFAFFFRKEFLVKRMFEVLNQEDEFRMLCGKLFDPYKMFFGIDEEEEILNWLYDNDDYALNIDRAASFFWWCGVCNWHDASVSDSSLVK